MQKLIQGVLQYSQTDMLQVPRELTDLDLVVDEVLLDLSEALQEKQVIGRKGSPAHFIPDETSVCSVVFKYHFECY